MIAIYDETWKFLVRQFGLTARHTQFNPFYIIDTLDVFIQSADDTILDIGCGDFNLKCAYPHKKWIGVDKTLEADIWGYPSEGALHWTHKFKYGVAINSLHHGNIKKNIEIATKHVNNLYVTLNEVKNIDEWKDKTYWEQFGKVKMFWHGQKSETVQQMTEYVQNDSMYASRWEPEQEHVNHVAQNGIHTDPYYGVVRVIISNE